MKPRIDICADPVRVILLRNILGMMRSCANCSSSSQALKRPEVNKMRYGPIKREYRENPPARPTPQRTTTASATTQIRSHLPTAYHPIEINPQWNNKINNQPTVSAR